MVRAIIGLLVTLALGSAQPNTSCVKVVNSTDASPYSDEEPSLTFTMDGVTNFTANSVSWSAISLASAKQALCAFVAWLELIIIGPCNFQQQHKKCAWYSK